MSAGLVVVEASMKSGSLITARMAAEYGRDVFAVPGHPMDPKAQGTNQLIKDGAIMLRDVSDILESMKNNMIYPESSISQDPPVLCDSSEFALEYIYDHDPQHSIEIILSHLNHTPLDLDDLVRDTNIPPHFLQDSLIELELEGKIQRHHGGGVSLLIDV
jgi:DNA processing protein